MMEAALWLIGGVALIAGSLWSPSRRLRNVAAGTMCAGALASTVLQASLHPIGHDLRAMCSGYEYARRGQPELAHRFDPPRAPLPVTYPLLAILPVLPACGDSRVYLVAWIAGCAAGVLMLRWFFHPLDWVLAIAIGSAAYRAVSWTVLTGNIQVLEFVLVYGAIGLLLRRRLATAGILLGAAGFIRLVPLVYGLLALPGGGRRAATRTVGASLLAWCALHAVFAVSMPDASKAYWRALRTGFGGALQNETWFGSTPNPSLFSLLLAIGRRAGEPVLVAAILLLLVFGCLAWRLRVAVRARGIDSRWAGLLLLLLLPPRLKPYSLVLAIAPTYVALRTRNYRTQIVGLVGLCAAPFAAFAATTVLPGSPGLLGYVQLFALMTTLFLLIHPRTPRVDVA